MKKKIDIDKKNGLVTVTIELPKRNSANDPILNFMTGDVRTLLESEGVHFGACRKKDSLSNHRDSDVRKGTWVFVTKKEQKQVKPTQTKKTVSGGKKESLTNKTKPANIGRNRSNSSSKQQKVVE